MNTKKALSNNQNFKSTLIERRKEIFVLLLFIISLMSFIFPSTKHIEGRWYLYNDGNRNPEYNLSELSKLNDYIIISNENIESFLSDSKNVVSSYDIKGKKLYSGNSIFKYDISQIENQRILTLELIGFTTPNTMVEGVEKATYVFDENFK